MKKSNEIDRYGQVIDNSPGSIVHLFGQDILVTTHCMIICRLPIRLFCA